MRSHRLSPAKMGAEKIVGGRFTIPQVGFMAVGLITWGILSSVLVKIIGFMGAILPLPALLIGIPFAFYTKEDMMLHKYLILKHRYKKEQHYFINSRYDSNLENRVILKGDVKKWQ